MLAFTPVLDSPERHVSRYLAATSRGDASAAMAEWSVYVSARDPRFHAPDELVARRHDLSTELAADRVGRDFTITSVDWWTTCCTPHLIADPRNAGLARVHVVASGADGTRRELVFEVWVKDLTWWGDAGGDWLHDWRLYEVHYEHDPCVFPSTAYGCLSGGTRG